MVSHKKALLRSFISHVMEKHTTQIKLSCHNELEKKVSYKCHLFCGRFITRFAYAINMTAQTRPKQISESFHQNKIRNTHSLILCHTWELIKNKNLLLLQSIQETLFDNLWIYAYNAGMKGIFNT